ncbi:MAG: carbonic anhydrase [Coriobacteriia bacterium]
MPITADTALSKLREGNRRFAEDRTLNRFAAEERAASAAAQQPWAVVVGCSDSRVPVEALFDVGVGELFVVRTAGHVLAEASLASVRFAVEKLGVELIVVLGHEDCGAVTAALAGDAPEWLAPIVSHIDVSHVDATRAPDDADDAVLAAAVDDHVRDTVSELREQAERFGTPTSIVGGAYKLGSGEVHWLDERESA